ncbi:MAG: hypothetical protein IT454_10210 [Planctomycetes bacterium]|nr:hypothetical protein [Planctomycetota bacterium]
MFGSLSQRFALAAILALSATRASAQQVLFADDFESGLGNWSTSSLWRDMDLVNEPCRVNLGGRLPGGAHVAAFNHLVLNSSCNFYGTPVGSLTSLLPISIPANVATARLRFLSFEDTECGGWNCGWDHRYVYVSNNGGLTWDEVAIGDNEYVWWERVVSLDAYLGQDILLRFHFDAIDSLWNDGYGWLVDDVVVEAEPVGTTYCVSTKSSAQCHPYVLATGDTSLTGVDNLTVTADLLLDHVMSKLVWSRAPSAQPFHGGTLCVQAPAARTPVTSSLGDFTTSRNCSGVYSYAFSHAYLASKGVLAGETLYVQASTRDPGKAAPNNHSLSNAISITILP